jgi:hypothetical protein
MEKTTMDACTIVRVMVQIDKQIRLAYDDGRIEDARIMCHIWGRLSFQQFDLAIYRGPLADPLYYPQGYQEVG